MRFVIIFKLFFERLASVKTFTIPLGQRKKQRNSDGNMTARQQAEKEGKSVSCMAKRWKDSFPGIPFAADSELTAEQLSAISKERKSGSVKNTETEMSGKSIMKRTPNPAGDKGYSSGKLKMDWAKFRAGAIDILLACIVAGHALLIWFDCVTLWGTPGLIGGGISLLIVLAALLFSMDSNLPRTSGSAMWFVFFVDCGAFWVHYPTFQRSATIGNNETIALCIFLCGMSFAALYLFRDSKLS